MTRPLSELVELKPCPFCSEAPERSTTGEIFCATHTELLSVEEWNRRSLPAESAHVILTIAEYERLQAELAAMREEKEAAEQETASLQLSAVDWNCEHDGCWTPEKGSERAEQFRKRYHDMKSELAALRAQGERVDWPEEPSEEMINAFMRELRNENNVDATRAASEGIKAMRAAHIRAHSRPDEGDNKETTA